MGCCNDKRPPRPPRPSVPCPDKYIDLSKIPAESYDDTDQLIGMNKCGLLHPVEKPEKLDKIVIDGDGTKVLTDDGQYKDIGEITDDLNYVAYNAGDDAELKKSIILKNSFSIKATDKDGTIFSLLALSAANEARLGNLSLPLVYVSRNRPTIITLENGNEVSKKVAYQDEIPDVSDLTQLRTDVDKNTNDISGLETQMSNVVGEIADINTDLTGLKGRMTTAEGKITVNESNIDTNKNDIAALKGRVDGHNSDIAGLGTRVTNNETNITNVTNRLGNAETNIQTNANEITDLKNDLNKTEHFRGYLDANVEIALLPNPRNGDYAYSAESGTVWSYNGVTWVNTGKVVPDKTVPAYGMTPNMAGVGSSGISDAYARGDHRHPTDTTRASAVDLIATNSNVTAVSDALGAYKATNDTRVSTAEGNINTNKNETDALKVRVTNAETDISVNTSDIAGLRADLANKEHFRGYYATTLEVITIANPEKGDFTYNAQTGTKWAYNGAAWSDTLSIVPDQTVEGSNDTPTMNGVSTPGASNKYSRSDHVHPMDSTRASAADLNATNLNVTNLGDRVTINEGDISDLKDKLNDSATDLSALTGRVSKNETDIVEIKDDYAKKTDLAAVATSGDYNDLLNKPTIPTLTWGTIGGTLSNQTDLRTALDGKVDKVAGKDLSDENYTTVEKTKLSGVEAGAQANVQSDWNQTDTTKDDFVNNKPDLSVYAEKTEIPVIPTDVSAFNNDAKYVTETELEAGLDDVLDKVAQSNWIETDNTKPAFIKNKPIFGTMSGEKKDDYVTSTDFNTALDGKITKVHAGTNVTITGTSTEPIVSVTGIELPEKFTSTENATGVVGDAVTGLDLSNVTEIVTGSTFGLNDIVIFSNGTQGQVVTYDSGVGTYDIVIVQIPEATAWGAIGGNLSNQTDLKAALYAKTNDADLKTVAKSGSYNDLTDKPTIPPTGWGTIAGTLTDQTDLKTALDGKVDKVAGKDLSDDNYTTVEKTKLAGVEAGAQVNVQSDWDQSDTTKDDFVNNKPDLSVYAEKTDIPVIPTNVSAFNNDSGYITASDVDLSGYYTKIETDTKLTDYAKTADLATVAKTGSYNDLTDTPVLDNVVRYDSERNVNLSEDKNIIIGISNSLAIKDIETSLTYNGITSNISYSKILLKTLTAGTNLRGKTIVFQDGSNPTYEIIFGSLVEGANFTIVFNPGDLSSVTINNNGNNIDISLENGAFWYMTEYTFPDDKDYIISYIDFSSFASTGDWSIDDVYVGQSRTITVGDAELHTRIGSNSRPTWEGKGIATVDLLFKHAFVTQSQYDALGDATNIDGITYFILEALQRVIFIRNDTTTHDYYFLISKKNPTTQQLVSLGTQIGAGGSTDSISKYMDVNNDVNKLVDGINDLTIYYGGNTGAASFIPVTEDNLYIVTI